MEEGFIYPSFSVRFVLNNLLSNIRFKRKDRPYSEDFAECVVEYFTNYEVLLEIPRKSEIY